jgi:hypothetical protein
MKELSLFLFVLTQQTQQATELCFKEQFVSGSSVYTENTEYVIGVHCLTVLNILAYRPI